MAKRILIYTNHFYPEQFKINEIVQWLSYQDCHIRVITGLPNYPSGKIFKGYNNIFHNTVTINRLFLIPRGSGSNIMLLVNYISYFVSCFFFTLYIAIFKQKYDIIFVHHTSPILIAFHPLIYSVFRKTKMILWDLDIWPETLKAVNITNNIFIINLIEVVVKYLYSFYESILVGSKSLVKVVSKRYKGKIIYFPNWADKNIEKNIIDKDYNLELDKNKFNIMYTGNIGLAQNFTKLIDTIEHVDEKVKWIFVGDGRFKVKFKDLIKKRFLTEKVTFIDHVNIERIPSVIKNADSLFLSLKNDNIFFNTVPAKLQTYMALGKPIIGLLRGDAADIIKQSNCGIVEENYDYTELAEKINSFANKLEPELNQLGNNARSFYEKNFSSDLRKLEILKIIYGS